MRLGALGRLFLPAALIILASCEGGSNTNIDDRVILFIAVTPLTPTLTVGSTIQLSASATDVAGEVVNGATFRWSSFAPSVATVDASSGLVTGVGPGAAIIDALIPGVTISAGSATVTVVAAAPAPPGGG